MERLVFIDNCGVDRLASNGIDPIKALRDTEFKIAFTPDLQIEYERALNSPNAQITPAVVQALRTIIAHGVRRAFFGFDGAPFAGFDEGMWASQAVCDALRTLPDLKDSQGRPRKRTDLHLALLALDHIVVTANTKEGVWRRFPSNGGSVIQWITLRDLLSVGISFRDALRRLGQKSSE